MRAQELTGEPPNAPHHRNGTNLKPQEAPTDAGLDGGGWHAYVCGSLAAMSRYVARSDAALFVIERNYCERDG